MRRRIIYAGLAVVLLMAVVACATNGMKSFGDMSHKERAAFFMSVYNSQADDYKIMAANPALTEDQKKLLREKKKIMTQVYPLIGTYTAYVDAGTAPTPEVEQQILTLINQLTATVITTVQ